MCIYQKILSDRLSVIKDLYLYIKYYLSWRGELFFKNESLYLAKKLKTFKTIKRVATFYRQIRVKTAFSKKIINNKWMSVKPNKKT